MMEYFYLSFTTNFHTITVHENTVKHVTYSDIWTLNYMAEWITAYCIVKYISTDNTRLRIYERATVAVSRFIHAKLSKSLPDILTKEAPVSSTWAAQGLFWGVFKNTFSLSRLYGLFSRLPDGMNWIWKATVARVLSQLLKAVKNQSEQLVSQPRF
jgi:hypothetical protein